MNKASASVVAVVLVSLPGLGCTDPKAREIERLRAEAEAAREESVRARAEAEAVRAELVQALADAHIARTELARLKGEPPPAVKPRTVEPEVVTIEKRFASLKANYENSAININEWHQMKAKLIEGIPTQLPASERRSLGQRLIDLKAVYDAGALNINEWTTVKAKVIAQVPSPRTPAPVLDKELAELKRAYDASAMTINEWTQAKAQVAKWAK